MEQDSCLNDDDDDIGGSIIDARDISDHEQLVMKGDLVGNTAYSAKWILKILLTLSKLDEDPDNNWSEDLETELCFLWDMTTEKDIVDFLVENNFLPIAEYILKIADHYRLKEIIIGIIGNMCSQPDALLHIANMSELIEVILIHITSPDTETLIQVLRILQAAMWDIQRNDSSKWREILVQCEFLGQSLTFILESSTNESLLTAALSLLQSIAITELNDENSSLLHKVFETTALISSLKSAFNQLISTNDENYEEKDQENIKNWLDIVSNLLQKHQGTFEIANYLDIHDILIAILHREEMNLIPLEETRALYIYQCIDNIYWCQQKNYIVNPKDICVIVNIAVKLKHALTINCDDETINELLQYIEKYLLKLTEQNKIIDIIKLFECSPYETKKYLISFIADNGSIDLKCKLKDIKHI